MKKMDAEQLIESAVKGSVDEASIALAPGSDALNTIGNAGTLLDAAITQITATIRHLKGMGPYYRMAGGLRQAQRSILDAKTTVDNAMDQLMED